LGKTISELEASVGPQEMLKWQIFFHQDHWRNRVKTETAEGKSNAILSLLMGKNG
tara:strand:- start:546 stop:710 length:165 start_codon:yes stop_codon:yes gene_type:complete